MKRTLLAAALAVCLADSSSARAQFLGAPSYGGFGFSYNRPGFHMGGFYARPPFFPPIMPFGYGPGWGFGSSWNSFSFSVAPRVIVIPPPIIVIGNLGSDEDGNPAAGANAMAPRPAAKPQPPGPRGGNFVVIQPKKNFPPPGGIAPVVNRVAGPLPLLPPPAKFDPFAKPVALKAEKPEADPEKEAARLMKLGRGAFEAAAYGKAGEFFERAAAANPKAAEPHFLQAQALFAAGLYVDAVTAIREGLALDPTWPASIFDTKEPYGVNAVAFAGHLAELRKVIAANPGEPALEFLLGYQLWFIGEKAEAKKWFALAEKTLPAPGPIALFK